MDRPWFGAIVVIGAFALGASVMGLGRNTDAGESTPRQPLVEFTTPDDLYALFDDQGYVRLLSVVVVGFDDLGTAYPYVLDHYEWLPLPGKTLVPPDKFPGLIGYERLSDPRSWSGVAVSTYLDSLDD